MRPENPDITPTKFYALAESCGIEWETEELSIQLDSIFEAQYNS